MLSTSLRQQLDNIAENIANGMEEAAVVQVLSGLLREEKVEEWSHSSSHLNLLQLAVFHGRTRVIEHLCQEGRRFMEMDLYRRKRSLAQQEPNHPHCSESQTPTWDERAAEQLPREVSGDGSTTPMRARSNQSSTPFLITKNGILGPAEEKEDCEAGVMVNHPLHMACWLRDLNSLKALVKPALCWENSKGFSLHSRQEDGKAVFGKTQLQELMKSVSVITGDMSASGKPVHGLPLELAVDSKSVGCVTFLLRKLLWDWVFSQFYFMCLGPRRRLLTVHLASCFSSTKLLALLLASRPRDVLHHTDDRGQTALHLAVWTGDTDTIRLLLEHGADVNALTNTGAGCLQILYRSTLMPCAWEANTRLLLQYGANPTVTYPPQNNQTPLQVLMEEISQVDNRFNIMLKKKSVEHLAVYARSTWGSAWESAWNLSTRDCLQSLVNCVRLLLEGGADPNMLDSTTPPGDNAIQVFMRMTWPAGECGIHEKAFLLMSTLLEFGANMFQNDDFGPFDLFLLRIHRCNPALQTSFVHMFTENGLDPDVLATQLAGICSRNPPVGASTWHDDFWACVASQASWRGLRALSSVLDPLSVPESRCQVVMGLYGSPVRRLRHSCKVAVWKSLGHRVAGVDSLPVPGKVKSYLRSDDL